MEETDGDLVGSREACCGSVCSVVMETPQLKVMNQEVGLQFVESEREVVENNLVGGVVDGTEGDGLRGSKELIGPICIIDPCDVGGGLAQRKGKEIVVYEENKKNKTLKGSTSSWAPRAVGLCQTILIDKNIEVAMLKDKEVALLAEIEKTRENGECRKKPKDGGCKKLPLFFGPNKWENLAKAHKANGGKIKSRREVRRKEWARATVSTEDSQGDEIQSSDNSGDFSVGAATRRIPVSNIQIVLNEGEVNRPLDDNLRTIRVEAERLFHIGLNLGITSNEERLGILDRMVDLEMRDERNFESEGGDEVVR
jgi:hypothetical protein